MIEERNNLVDELNGRPLRLLIGGSPCTYWSIAQKNNRETKAEGLGWELFKNYLIAKEKFEPDFFLYENNKSAAQSIKNQISHELGVGLQYINSALVSAQNRQRFYAHNIPGVDQPEDRGILLKDIIESGMIWKEKSYTLDANYWKMADRDFNRQSGRRKCVADPIRIGTIKNKSKNKDFDSQQYRVYSPVGKSVTICGQGGGVGAKTGLYATPVRLTNADSLNEKAGCLRASYYKSGQRNFVKNEIGRLGYQGVIENIKLFSEKEFCILTDCDGNLSVGDKFIYQVKEGCITYKEKQYHISLPDGFYIIRKLSPVECERLQTLPDGYTEGISDTQRYKCLGNGWTAEVIIHILSFINCPKDYPIEVLSIYDGIATGRYCLEKLGYTNITYKAYEIDKYAIQVALKNYPDIIECGDAFQIREDDWEYQKEMK